MCRIGPNNLYLMKELTEAKLDYGVRREGYHRNRYYLRTDLGSWYPATEKDVRFYLRNRCRISSRELNSALARIALSFTVRYAGAEAEHVAFQHRHELGASPSPSPAYRLPAGEHLLPSGDRILTTCDIRLPSFDL
jgi:hypothetical protein